MTLDEEVMWYLATAWRRRQLARLEAMAARPSLSVKRRTRPRVGVLRRLVRFLAGSR